MYLYIFLNVMYSFFGDPFFLFLKTFLFLLCARTKKTLRCVTAEGTAVVKTKFFFLFPFLYFFSSIAKPPAPPSNTIKMKKTSWVYTCPPPKKKKNTLRERETSGV